MKQTYLNLARAYLGECQARNRYTFYASIAKKEGYEQIAEIFRTTADQEKEHASNLFKLIDQLHQAEEGMDTLVLPEVEVPNMRGTTEENLLSAIEGETHEYSEMYPNFADIAADEGYPEIAARLRAIAKAESGHAEVYQKLYELVKSGTFFKRSEEKIWVCRECGYVHVGKEPPKVCPSCDHPQAYYEIKRQEF